MITKRSIGTSTPTEHPIGLALSRAHGRRQFSFEPAAPVKLQPALFAAYQLLRRAAGPSAAGTEQEFPGLVLLLSSSCNMGCQYCFADQGSYQTPTVGRMSTDTVRHAIDAIVGRFGGLKHIKFFGGEPSLNVRAIAATCEYVTRLYEDARIPTLPTLAIVTNLVRLPKALVELIRDYKIAVTVSLDGPADVHDRLRPLLSGRPSHARTIENIRRLQEAADQPSGIECVYTPLHYDLQIRPIALTKYFRELGVPIVLMHPLVNPERDLRPFEPSVVRDYALSLRSLQRENVKAEVVQVATQEDHPAQYVRDELRSLQATRTTHCSMGFTTYTADASGGLWPCYMSMSRSDEQIGDVRRTEALEFERVWSILKTVTKPHVPVCQQCDLIDTCHACLGQMISVEAQERSVVPSQLHCEWLAGTVEGLLDGVMTIRQDPEMWKLFQTKMSPSSAEPRRKVNS